MKLKLPLLFLFGFVLFCIGCDSGTSTTTTQANFDTSGFETMDHGNGITYLVKRDGDKFPIEEGYLKNGLKNGAWTVYHPDGNQIKTITSYIDGTLSGPTIELDTRSQMLSLKNYANHALNGLSATYKFGKVVTELPYVNGQLNGTFKEYLNGKLQRKIDYVDGKKHGKLTYYDEEGNKTVEYDYKNDEKLGGGIIE